MECLPYCRVKQDRLKLVGRAITKLPVNFKPHRAVEKLLKQRVAMIETGKKIDWAFAEALAFATLLEEGNHIRLSGQDVERGNFNQRHAILHDQETGATYCPLDHVVTNQNEGLFTVSNR
jgi:2-oxoglutarate dehydrogenase E1 component